MAVIPLSLLINDSFLIKAGIVAYYLLCPKNSAKTRFELCERYGTRTRVLGLTILHFTPKLISRKPGGHLCKPGKLLLHSTRYRYFLGLLSAFYHLRGHQHKKDVYQVRCESLYQTSLQHLQKSPNHQSLCE